MVYHKPIYTESKLIVEIKKNIHKKGIALVFCNGRLQKPFAGMVGAETTHAIVAIGNGNPDPIAIGRLYSKMRPKLQAVSKMDFGSRSRRFEFQTRGIRLYVEDLKPESNKEMGAKDFFEMACSLKPSQWMPTVNEVVGDDRSILADRNGCFTFQKRTRQMIPASATIEGTEEYAARHPRIAFSTLGRTGLRVSPAGFGCYRVAKGITDHENALKKALMNGINLIDTSTNYADGDSERLVGEVLQERIQSGELNRDQVIVVSKAGYLQGQNYALSQERKQSGREFEDLVPYGKDLEHCIHPEFLEDQLDRSLRRLQLETLDVFLLHNPEYYLSWAHGQGADVSEARREYHQRLQKAFIHLETEVARGRIRWYGVSSNTFPALKEDPEFTDLSMLLELTAGMTSGNHFGVVQLPMNLLEAGAVLHPNQTNDQNVLELAHKCDIGVLINRPLNAMDGDHLLRLAEIATETQYTTDDIIHAIGVFKKSEKHFSHRLLPLLDAPEPLMHRIAEQLSVGDQMKHYWRNFGNYERWRQARAGFFLPRVQGVLQYLGRYRETVEGLGKWMDDHTHCLQTVLDAVESQYTGEAKRRIRAIRQCVCAADEDWCQGQTLSQMAVRSVRSTRGVSCVLVGMRHIDYVDDVLTELHRPIERQERAASWKQVAATKG